MTPHVRRFLPLVSRYGGRRTLAFFANFGGAKLAIYVIPLAIAALSTPVLYGSIELTLSIGVLIASVLVGAPIAGLNQVVLVRGDRDVQDQIALMVVLGSGVAALSTLLALAVHASPSVLIVAASLSAAVVHIVLSATTRLYSQRNLAAWADGAGTLFAGVAATVAMVVPASDKVRAATIAYGFLALVNFGIALPWLVRARVPGLATRAAELWRIGLPVAVLGVLAVWMSTGGRILVGVLAPDDLPAYGLAFRVTGLALGVQQLAVTAFFAQLYKGRTKQVDRLLALFLIPAIALSLVLVIAGRWLPDWLHIRSFDDRQARSYALILPLGSVQILYWIGYAMLQSRISRYRLAGKALPPTVGVTLAGIAVIVATGVLWPKDIWLLSLGISLHTAAYFYVNHFVLLRAGLPHRSMVATISSGAALLWIIALAIRWW